jgi:hypothetical protein
MKKYIRVETITKDKLFKPERLTEQEKTARLYALAEKIGVKIYTPKGKVDE